MMAARALVEVSAAHDRLDQQADLLLVQL